MSTCTPYIKMLKLLRVFRLLKLLRLLRVSRLLEKYQDKLMQWNNVIMLVRLVLTMVFIAHWMVGMRIRLSLVDEG